MSEFAQSSNVLAFWFSRRHTGAINQSGAGERVQRYAPLDSWEPKASMAGPRCLPTIASPIDSQPRCQMGVFNFCKSEQTEPLSYRMGFCGVSCAPWADVDCLEMSFSRLTDSISNASMRTAQCCDPRVDAGVWDRLCVALVWKRKKPHNGGSLVSQGLLVAGAGFEPAAFRL